MSRFVPSLDVSWNTRPTWIGACFALWLGMIGLGTVILTSYVNDAGIEGVAPVSISNASRKYQLRMFAHPHCPCSMASARELARTLSRCDDDVETTVYLYRPRDAQADWTHGRLRETLAEIPRVRLIDDLDGAEAERFGATTSGDVVLYDPEGILKFHGGITAGRGHEGDNRGKSAVEAIVRADENSLDRSPVFGCALHPKRETCDE
jgi:hypothetical protein